MNFRWRNLVSASARYVGCFLFAFVALLPSAARANLVQNGNFAGGSGTGWVFNYGPTRGPFVPPFNCGINCHFLSENIGGKDFWLDPWDLCQCTITQNVATVIGRTYRVSYSFGIRVDVDSPGYFDAWFGNASLHENGPFTGPGVHPVPWQIASRSFLINAVSTVSSLEFGGLCPGCNFAVTDIQVTAVPSVGTIPLMSIAAVGFLIFFGRRRTSREQDPAGPFH